MKKSKIKFLLLLAFCGLISCQKQSAPEVDPDEGWRIKDEARLEACTKVNFSKGLLRHENTIFLFRCSGWDEKFPSLNRGINSINPASWNHFFGPVDDAFLNNKEKRDRIFDHIRLLDSKRGLDDLSLVITALNETNFYDGLRNLFACAENVNHASCKNRKEKVLTKKNIKSLITLVDLEPIVIKALATLIREVVHSIGKDADGLKEEIKTFFYKENFVRSRLKLVDTLSQKVVQGLTPLEKEFYRKIPSTKWKDSNEAYLYSWIQRPSFTNAIFRRLTDYAVTENPNIIKDLRLVKRAYHFPVYCVPYSNEGRVDINLKAYVDGLLNEIYTSDYEPFHDYVIQNVASLQTALTFCPKLKSYSGVISFIENGEVITKEHALNFVELKKKTVDLTAEIPIFDIFKFITYLASRNLGDIPPNPGFLLDIATEELSERVIDIIKVIHFSSENYFDLNFKILKKLRPFAFDSVGVLTNELLQETNEKKMMALSKTWLFFDKTEQNFLFNFIDQHLKDETDYLLLFDYYATMLEEYADVSKIFSERWTSNKENIEKSYRSLHDIVYNFSGTNVLKDFSAFFSRDHIIAILKIVTRGPALNRVALDRLNSSLISSYISKLPTNNYLIDFTDAENDYYVKAKLCIDAMTESDSLYVILNNFPVECNFFKHKEITLQTFSWLAQIQDEYNDLFNLNHGAPTLLDGEGLLSSTSLNNSIAVLRIVDERLAYRVSTGSKATGGIKYLMDTAQKHLYSSINKRADGLISDIITVVKLAANYLESGGRGLKYLRNKKALEIFSDDSMKLEELLKVSAKVLNQYSEGLDEGQYEAKKYTKDFKYDCENYVNKNIGGIPCPSKRRIKRSLKSIFKDMVRLNGENETSAMGFFLQAFAGGGLEIPLDSKSSSLKRLTFKESAEMVYRLTDPKYSANNLYIKFKEDDSYDESYLVENWSGVKWSKEVGDLSGADDSQEHEGPSEELIESKASKVKLNTLERIEITIRDVRFDMNYLGGHYKNSVAKGEDYNETVKSKLKMFKRCVGARFCGKFFNKQQLRMGRNAVSAYPGLLDANRVKEFGFGDYMKVLLGAFVRSSSRPSQKTKLFKIKIFGKGIEVPWVQTKKQLRQHNGRILTKISMLSGLSHVSRIVRDRMGRTEDDFNKNINSKKLETLDKQLMKGIDINASEKHLKSFLLVLSGENIDKETIVDGFVDWISGLEYQEQREFEELVLNTLVTLSFLGVPDEGLGYESGGELVKRYKDNNLTPILLVLSDLISSGLALSKNWPSSLNLMDIVSILNRPMRFMSEELVKNKNLSINYSYQLINELYLIFKKLLSEDTEHSINGSKYLANYLKEQESSQAFAKVLEGLTRYFEYLEMKNANNKSGLRVLSENLTSIVEDKRFDLTNIKSYFLASTSPRACEERSNCRPNIHYDEPARLLIYASKKQGSANTNIEKLLNTLFKEYINDYTEMFDNLLPFIRVNLNN